MRGGGTPARVDGLRAMCIRELERRGIQRAHSAAAADLVTGAVKNALADERGRWLLGAHPEARSEHRLRMRGKDGLRSYAIDRLFRDAAGERWIVDFKTSRHEGAGLEEFSMSSASATSRNSMRTRRHSAVRASGFTFRFCAAGGSGLQASMVSKSPGEQISRISQSGEHSRKLCLIAGGCSQVSPSSKRSSPCPSISTLHQPFSM
jgi:hypothetical protein